MIWLTRKKKQMLYGCNKKNSGIANPSDKQFGKGATPVIPDYIQTFPYQDPSSPLLH
jgi:hypothetical protein